jgi:hypothetical protein
VTVADWSLETVPAVSEKLALLAPDNTVTEPGTVKAAALLERDTTTFALTAFDITTVQVDDAPDPKVPGKQETDVNTAAETKETDVVTAAPP